MMQLRRSQPGTRAFTQGQRVLDDVAAEALRFYGARSLLYVDILTSQEKAAAKAKERAAT